MKNFLSKIVLLVITLSVLYVLIGVVRSFIPSEEKNIQTMLDSFAEAAEQRDVDSAFQFISDEYDGAYSTSKEKLRQEADRGFGNVDELSISIEFVDIDIEGNEAKGMIVYDFRGVITSTGVYSRAPFHGIFTDRPSRLEVIYAELIKEGDHWRIVYFTWETDNYLPNFPDTTEFLK